MDLKGLYFPVEKVENPEIANGVELPSGLQYAVKVTKPDGGIRTVNYCSELYHLVPNEEVIPLFLDEISRYYQVDVSYRVSGWSKFFIDFIIKDQAVEIMKRDNIYPKLRVINSYDGSVRYQYIAGIWRQICGNGMGVWDSKTRLTKMHTPAIGEEVSFSKVMELVSQFILNIDEHTEVYQELNGSEVDDPAARIEEVIEETKFPTSLHEDVLFRLEEEKAQLNVSQISDWLIYNAFNYQLNHNEDLKAKENKKETMDQEVLQFLLNY